MTTSWFAARCNMAVDPQVCLDLGINGQGTTAENHHVCPIHPEYAELPPITVDKDAAYRDAARNPAMPTTSSRSPRSTATTAGPPPTPSQPQLRDAGFTWNGW
jgi:hypothetical protein